MRAAIEPAVAAYRRHGPLLRALAEAAARDVRVAAAQERMRGRFDELAARSPSELLEFESPITPEADVAEMARALNRMNESYLLEAFGRDSPDLRGDRRGRPDRDLGLRDQAAARLTCPSSPMSGSWAR